MKGNQFKPSNSLRNSASEAEEHESITVKPRPRTVKATEKGEEKLPPFNLAGGRLVKVLGLFMLLLSTYFLVAFTSYLLTWQDDQSYVIDANGGWSNLFKTPAELAYKQVATVGIVQNWMGKFGALLSHQFIYEWFGVASFLFVFVLFVLGFRLLFKVKLFPIGKTLAYSFFSLLFVSLTLAYFHAFVTDFPHYLEGEFGFWAYRLLEAQIGNVGTLGLLTFAGLTMLTIAYNFDFKLPERAPKYVVPEVGPDELVEENISEPVEFPLNNRFQDDLAKEDARIADLELETEVLEDELEPEFSAVSEGPEVTIEKTPEEATAEELVQQFGAFDPKLELSQYKHPHLDLLENYGSAKISVNAEELEANKTKIVETLNHYNIEIDKIKATIGPTVTLYEIIPAPGVRISKIKNLEDDIALSLAALGIRIIAPMPGKGTIGIEVPNQNPDMVSMRSLLGTEKFQNTTMELPIALGKTISNEVYIADLAKMPHLLVAGATGQGKSVGINCILASLLYKMHPSQLKFVLVDPKKVELTLFRKIERHFLAKLPGEEDAIITVNRYNFALEEASRSENPSKNAEMGYIGNYNYFIYYDGKLKKFSNPIKVPSSPKAPLKVLFDNIQSEVYKDITIEYRIRNSAFRNYYLIANGNIQIMFQWKLFDNVGTAYPEANFITYEKGSMSIFKDILIYTGKIKNYSPVIPDVYTYNPEIEKAGGLQYRFFYDPRSLKYMTRKL